MVARVGGDLPLHPVGHGEAVVGPGDLVQAVEQDQAPAAAPAGAPTSRPAPCPAASPTAARIDVGQRDRRVGDDRLGPLAQREQDRDAPAAGVPAAEVTPHGARRARAAWASRVLLPLPGWPTSARTTRARRSSSSPIELPGRGVPGRRRRPPGARLRGPADQRDVDVDVAQLRDVVAAGREVLHVDVPERVKHPPPVPVAVPGNGRRLHHVSPPHLRHPALR